MLEDTIEKVMDSKKQNLSLPVLNLAKFSRRKWIVKSYSAARCKADLSPYIPRKNI
jgi:hypothetical protein